MSSDWYFPAEFEAHDAIWLAWPVFQNKRGICTKSVLREIITALQGHVRVELLVENSEVESDARDFLKDSPHVSYRHISYDGQIWMRDFGPHFLRKRSGGDTLRIAGFKFATWGYESSEAPQARLLTTVIPKIGQMFGMDVESHDYVHEGGSHESNGESTLILCETVERHRNPHMTLEQIDEVYHKAFGLKNIIWMDNGVADDDHTYLGPLHLANGEAVYTCNTTGGHTDEFVRFVSQDTILLTEVSEEEAKHCPIAALTRERMEVNYKRLLAARDENGQPFKILRMPIAPLMTDTVAPGDQTYEYIAVMDNHKTPFPHGSPIKVVLPTSYMNFLVTNGVVLVGQYHTETSDPSVLKRDNEAKELLAKCFPNHKIVGINVLPVNYGGGGIHCISQQQPKP